MGNMFCSEWYRLMRGWKRWGLVLIITILFLYQGLHSYSTSSGFDHPNVYQAYLSALGTGPAAYWIGVLPLVSTFIGADTFTWDRRTSLIRFYLSRTSGWRYALGKWFAVMVHTLVVMGIGLLIGWGIALARFPLELPPWHVVNGIPTITTPGAPTTYRNPFPVFGHHLFFTHPSIYVFLVSLIVVLSACTWASLGTVFSLWSQNVYLTLAGPWLVYIAVTGIFALPFTSLINYSPLVMSGPLVNNFNANPLWAVAYWLVIIVILTFTLIWYYGRRRDIFD